MNKLLTIQKPNFDFVHWKAYLIGHSIDIAIAIGIGLLILIATHILRSLLLNYSAKRSDDTTVVTFIINAIYVIILTLILIMILGKMGIPTASLITILGASSLAIALALRDSLSNVASGIIIIFLKPFKIGDFVEFNSCSGTVDRISLYATRFRSPNNEMIIIPNSKLTNDKIINKTFRATRRLDLSIGIGYDANIKIAKQTIAEIIAQDERILKSPEPVIGVKNLADSAVVFAVQPWVKKADYMAVMYDLLENIKLTFDSKGISIPFPQLDVHFDKPIDTKI